ncbi:MAG: cell wall surface anchor family protein [uncultured bacterium]|uniref:Cell wall surface anchor family protein n=2 Tax=Candidatus Wolfeibacteriota TaxID=1752735 RepID=A0A0G1H9R1_9BACT|nr:MAG: cell wall surface anchor family protein [uncultured bacterium]KKR12370.1 MAG: Cell wall surface anchor family protein [Candidatus Wolfebacteria bacterium GW2011_GWC2_39_22]KKT43278.1 MAG: Cell wall surface anchor family protein [Candidatus Wolfebacteria bacterium GW2011_GWE2_44_13]HBI25996.1 hypothetical protein [Candidatus Wolfebacteria bacterium]
MKSTRGFSLLETLLYIAIFAIVGGSLFGILTNVVRVSTTQVSNDEVTSQLQFAMETVTRLVRESSAIEIATTTATTTLKLRMANPLKDPTCISLSGGVLKLAEGPDAFQAQNCTAATTNITTDNIVVDTAFFKRIEFPGGHDQVAVDLQFSNLGTGAGKISRALRSGISRVSAATFDSDLLPSTDNNYEIGFSGTKRWKNISVSNVLNLGVIASDPSGIDGSVYYNSTSKTFRGKANGAWSDLGSSLWISSGTNMYSNVTGNTGVGTLAPAYKFDVTGDVRLDGNIGIASSTPSTTRAINIGKTYSDTTGYGIYNATTITGALTAARSGYGMYNILTSTADNTAFANTLYGTYSLVSNSSGTGYNTGYGSYNRINNNDTTLTNASSYGGYDYVSNASTGILTNAYGNNGLVVNETTGSIGTARGVYGYVRNDQGTITTARAVDGTVSQSVAGGTITTGVGGYFDVNLTAGTLTTGYGVYIASIAGTTNYGIYQSDSTNKNYFAGNVGIGTTAPGQKLSVAGTVESTSGGFKFPDGTTQTKAIERSVVCPFSTANSCNFQPNEGVYYLALKKTGLSYICTMKRVDYLEMINFNACAGYDWRYNQDVAKLQLSSDNGSSWSNAGVTWEWAIYYEPYDFL